MPDTGRAEALYEAAVVLFLDRGYRDVDVADITALVGVSQGTFYNYYRNKRDVLETIMNDTESKLLEAFGEEVSSQSVANREEYVAEFEVRVRRVITCVAERGALMSFAALTAPGVDADSYASVLRGYRALSAAAAAFLSFGQSRGWIRPDVSVDIAGQAVVSAMAMAVLPVLVGDAQTFDVDSAAIACSGYLLNGVRGVLPQSADA